jgi:hypothetical protein
MIYDAARVSPAAGRRTDTSKTSVETALIPSLVQAFAIEEMLDD